MDNLWKHDENVICVHPGWELLVGWLAIRESWVMIFQNTEVIKFNITNPKIRLFDNDGTGIVVCQENIGSSINGQLDKIGVKVLLFQTICLLISLLNKIQLSRFQGHSYIKMREPCIFIKCI
jgi:hypothetical protein